MSLFDDVAPVGDKGETGNVIDEELRIRTITALFEYQKYNSAPSFGSEENLSIMNLTSKIRHRISMDTFVEYLSELSSYFAFIGCSNPYIVCKEPNNNLSIYTWKKFRKIYEEFTITLDFRYREWKFDLVNALELFCMHDRKVAYYTGIVSNPNYKGSELLNIFEIRGPNTPTPVIRSKYTTNPKILDHIRYNLVGGIDNNYEYVLTWLTAICKEPYKQLNICPIFLVTELGLIYAIYKHLYERELQEIDLDNITDINNLTWKLAICDEIDNQGLHVSRMNVIKKLMSNINKQVSMNGGKLTIPIALNFCILAKQTFLDQVNFKYFPVFISAQYEADESIYSPDVIEEFVGWLKNRPSKPLSSVVYEPPHFEEDHEEPSLEDIIAEINLDDMLVSSKHRTIKFLDVYNEYVRIFDGRVTKTMKDRQFYAELKAYFHPSNKRNYIHKDIGNSNNCLVKEKKHKDEI